MTDAGRVIAGSARGVRLRAPGHGDAPARRQSQANALRDPRTGPGRGARPGPVRGERRGRDRGAVARRRLGDLRGEGPAGRRRSSTRTCGRRRSPARELGSSAADALALARPSRPPPSHRSTSSSSTRPTPKRTCWPGSLAALGAADAPLAPAARVVAKHFWRDRPPDRIGLLASERDRRFGETALTFYRREEER